jgi:hypothetical protein
MFDINYLVIQLSISSELKLKLKIFYDLYAENETIMEVCIAGQRKKIQRFYSFIFIFNTVIL